LDTLLDFSQRNVLITGAASGFGRELALALAQRGASLVLSDINEPGLEETIGLLPETTATAALPGDVANESTARDLVALAVERFGQLHIAINNAGVAPHMNSMTATDSDVLAHQLAVNCNSVVFGMKHQLAHMAEQRNGAILNVSSMAGIGGAPMLSTYAAAKHAVVGLTKSAAVEFGGKNIRVNAVCPFFTLTPMVDNPVLNPNNSVDELNQTLAARCPLRRVAQPGEVVAVMLMMISPANTYMNGVAIPVDGGVSAM
jgi:NAD(P)-dependent dehydrogenase (short-subunit alcohol dehydrogenase family)